MLKLNSTNKFKDKILELLNNMIQKDYNIQQIYEDFQKDQLGFFRELIYDEDISEFYNLYTKEILEEINKYFSIGLLYEIFTNTNTNININIYDIVMKKNNYLNFVVFYAIESVINDIHEKSGDS